ncbi:HSPB1-associated protein 1-like [Oppia nitens]|uniref:HSPB1-associated protein 1-like n=1 Tax=Oppia nitens TaxID=1686743 RepID=UPI0023D9C54F|nr:HSPB1-associated protein 1-like [Oppia nitens]
MDELCIDYNLIDTPLIIRTDALQSWPCFKWTINDWSEKCGETKLSFRVHKRISNTFWETEAIDRLETQLSDYVEWTQLETNECNDRNPFKKYSKSEHWIYSSYNYMNKLFEDNQQIIHSVNWSQLGLQDDKLESTAKNSTFWLGSVDAFTPCHQDSYGYNFVAQLSGKKQWILFPPSDETFLYPTRIPYEESSIFSSVDFHKPDYKIHPLFKQTSPHVIELKAGEILFVPHLWWHFVRVIEEDFDKSCISINTWIFNDCYQSSLNESIVRLLTTSLFNTYCPLQPNKWLNINADLFSPEEAIHTINLILNKMNSTIPINKTKSKILPKNSLEIKSSTFDELRLLFDNKKQESIEELSNKDVNIETIVNCILHPDVIEMIAQKLINIINNK